MEITLTVQTNKGSIFNVTGIADTREEAVGLMESVWDALSMADDAVKLNEPNDPVNVTPARPDERLS